MGAKQSKRSVDISGKEAEGAGEVAVAGAGGEGRLEQLADADALKPQLNGDAHIHESTDKEKELDSGTPENEKDATTEKENKEQDEEKDKEASPVSNGDGEKTENGESATTPDDGKKPKKEKVKKKWSLRSISFSRKDKPKQEKKQKEEEPKINGEPEKVPEETAEASPEPVVSEATEDVKATPEAKEEKAPDTPVTEPITNGSSTPESPKLDIPAAEEITAIVPEEDKMEVTPQTVSEFPMNGLSLDETKQEIPDIENKIEEIIASKSEETPVETTVVVSVPEIPVKKEVCVEQVPLIEPTPPPLPANPPPSSVASFAATTMAPELTDASLSNTAETAVSAQPPAKDSKTSINDNHSGPETNSTNVTDVLTLPSKDTEDKNTVDNLEQTEPKVILESFTDTLESIVETKIQGPRIESVPEEIVTVNETMTANIENKMEVSQNEPLPIETIGAVTEALESKINEEVEVIEVKQNIEKNEIETLETKTEKNLTDSVSKEAEQDLAELSAIVENTKVKDIEPSSVPLDSVLPEDDKNDIITAEVVCTDEDIKNNDIAEIKQEICAPSETNICIEPVVVSEAVDVVELSPPVPNEVDTQNVAMDESNDVDTQKDIHPSSQIDSDSIESNFVTDNKGAENFNIENTEVKVDNENKLETCKDSLGNVINTSECNGNIDKIAQEIVEVLTIIDPPADDIITSNTEAVKELVTPDDSLPPSLSEMNEPMPAVGSMEESGSFPLPPTEPSPPASPEATGDAPPHIPQDPLPEKVCDKMAELITEVSPVPELQTEMETSSDVAVAN